MYIVDMDDGLGLAVYGEHARVDAVVDALEHLVEYRRGTVGHALELLDAGDAGHAHVLGDFHGVGAPGGYHLAARAHESTFHGGGAQGLGSGEGPGKFGAFIVGELMVGLHGEEKI